MTARLKTGGKAAGWLDYAKRPQTVLTTLVTLFLLSALAPSIIVSVHSGEAGVLFRRFQGGTDTGTTYGEGVHFIFPWDRLYLYDVRIQESSQTLDVMTRNGLSVDVRVSIHYRPERDALGLLHQEIGPDYLPKVVVPTVTQVLRAEVGRYTAEEFFATRQPVVGRAFSEAMTQVGPRYIKIENVIVKSIRLPPAVRKAVEDKIEQQHLAEAYEFRITRERQEAKRKGIEAMGHKAFNETIASSLSPSILQWKGIEATVALASSPNAKVVVVGNSPSGLPIILGADK